MYEDYLERDRVKFRAADEDGDGKLSRTEFPFFMFPEQHQFMTRHVVGVSYVIVIVCKIAGPVAVSDCLSWKCIPS